MTLTYGERFGTLTVLSLIQTKNRLRYRLGCCTCGNSAMLVTASQFYKGKAWCRKCPRPRAKEAHEHQRPRTCCCNIQALEPDEDCPLHGGGEWPPRCEICGCFMPWPKHEEVITGE